MKDELLIKVQNHKLILRGCFNEAHPIPEGVDKVKVSLSDGTVAIFEHNKQYDNWFLKHNKKANDSPKYYDTVLTTEYGSSDEIKINYELTNATIEMDGEAARFIGMPDMSQDQKILHNKLIAYFGERGFSCLEDTRKDLAMMITGRY